MVVSTTGQETAHNQRSKHLFYTHTLIGVTGLPAAWAHNLVSNASASGVALTAGSLVARIFIQQATNTMTGFPIISDAALASNTVTFCLSVNAAALTTCRIEVQFMHSIPT